MPAMLEVAERGRTLAFSFEDVLKYHGGESPGGAAIAFKALECALPLLDPDRPPERRAVRVPFQLPRQHGDAGAARRVRTDEFIDLARADRDAAQEDRMDALKLELAERVMSSDEVFDLT